MRGRQGKYQMVPLDRIHIGLYPWSGADFVCPEAVDRIRASILRLGRLDNPLTVRPAQDHPDILEVVAGEHRYLAARSVQMQQVPVEVVRLSDREALETFLEENLTSGSLPNLKMAWAAAHLRRLRVEAGLPSRYEDLGPLLGFSSKGSTSYYVRLGDALPPRAIQAEARRQKTAASALLDLPVRAGKAFVSADRNDRSELLKCIATGHLSGARGGARKAAERFTTAEGGSTVEVEATEEVQQLKRSWWELIFGGVVRWFRSVVKRARDSVMKQLITRLFVLRSPDPRGLKG